MRVSALVDGRIRHLFYSTSTYVRTTVPVVCSPNKVPPKNNEDGRPCTARDIYHSVQNYKEIRSVCTFIFFPDSPYFSGQSGQSVTCTPTATFLGTTAAVSVRVLVLGIAVFIFSQYVAKGRRTSTDCCAQ